MPGEDETIDWRYRDGARWSEIRAELGVTHHDIFSALRQDIELKFGPAIVSAYEEGLGSRQIEAQLEIRSLMHCNGEQADYIVKRYLVSLPRKQFTQVNENRERAVGNTYLFTALEFEQESVMKKHRQGYRVFELANLFQRSMAEIKEQLGIG